MNQVQGGGSKVMSFGKSRAKRMSVDSPKITFRDVAGVDEAVEELHEIKEFLENPKKFQALGARIPKGVLLYGPPGTGKTLLARAVAGEAGVPFFSISGSDFVEMFVGVGASRVRDLFEQAKQNSPCIIFMDEIDAVGRHRGAGLGGGHDEREQTLNQLLVEMDGFEAKDNIIMIAATNRPDILDPALLRPGRFDRQITVDRPDRKGRAKILEVHTRGKPLAKDDRHRRARRPDARLHRRRPRRTSSTRPPCSPPARARRRSTQIELEEGIMRVVAGPEKKTRVMGEKERLITAYHEMGHAIVGHYLEHSDPVHKVSIISPRPGARLHDLAADRGQVPHHARGADRHDGDDARRPRRRGDRLRRDHHRRVERPREGHGDRQADGHALRHEREARPARVRPRPRPAVPRPRVLRRAGLLRRDRPRDRRRDPPHRRERAPGGQGHPRASTASTLETISEILLKRETIEREEFEALLDGKTEEEVFGPDEPTAARPGRRRRPDRPARDAPRPLPRPGLAGGGARPAALDPEKPDLA